MLRSHSIKHIGLIESSIDPQNSIQIQPKTTRENILRRGESEDDFDREETIDLGSVELGATTKKTCHKSREELVNPLISISTTSEGMDLKKSIRNPFQSALISGDADPSNEIPEENIEEEVEIVTRGGPNAPIAIFPPGTFPVDESATQTGLMSMESMYVIPNPHDDLDKHRLYLREAFSIFNENYDFDGEIYIDDTHINYEIPSIKQIYKYAKYICIASQLEVEIPIICLLYIEKLMMKTGLLMNIKNWKRFTFIALVIGSKVYYIYYII